MKIRLVATGFLLLFLFNGCSNLNPDPTCTFLDVRRAVCEKTGENVTWGACELEIQQCVDSLLQNSLTVDDAVKVALLNNRRLQSTFDELGIAQAMLVQAGLLKNPLFDVAFRYDKKWFSSNYMIDATGIQNVLDILLKPLKIKMAQAELETVKADVTGAVLDLIAETKIAFFSLQAEETSFQMKKVLLDAYEAGYDFALRLHDAGNITDLELTGYKTLYEQFKIDVANTEIDVLDKREALNILMGLWGCQITWSASHVLPDLPEYLPDLSNIECQAIANSLDLISLRKQIKAQSALVGINITETVFPEIGLGIDSERESDGNWFVGPIVSGAVPIFDFGQAQRAAGYAQVSKLCNEFRALAIDIRSHARQRSFHLQNSFREGTYYEKSIIPLSEKETYQTFLQYNAMQLGVFDLLSKKQEEINRKMDATVLKRDFWIDMTNLEKLIQGRM